jgi:chitobiase/beta-hexosaminidase-like protein/Big-like domain-containing protein
MTGSKGPITEMFDKTNKGSGVKRTRLKIRSAALIAIMAFSACVFFLAGPPVQAQLSKVGPIDPNTGFPFWYEDSKGVRLQSCLDVGGLCLSNLPNPNLPPKVAASEVDSNFPDEMFYWNATTDIAGANGVTGRIVMGLEGAFTTRVQSGDQITFSRIRIRISNLVQGASYRVTYPYGVNEFENVNGGDRGINYTEDIGIGNFPNGPLNGRIGPFLTWDTYGLPTAQGGPPDGFIGDPAVDHAVSGSPLLDASSQPQNYVRVERIDPETRQVLEVVSETNQFSVQGQLAGLAVTAYPRGATYSATQSITLLASDPATIYYTKTTDGTTPSDPSDPANALRVQYTAPISIPFDTTVVTNLRYVAIDAAGNKSPVVADTYNFVPPPPSGPTPQTPPKLDTVGAIDPNTGFPVWYQDATGVRLSTCLDPGGICLSTLPDPTKPPLVAAVEANSNFPDEMFYFSGDADLPGTNGVTGRLVLGLEGAFANRIETGDQIVFGRVRIRIDNLTQGASYRVTHPYGVDEFDDVNSGPRGINFTEDVGLTSFPNGALKSRIAPFLTWDTYGLPPSQGGPQNGFIGDPAVTHKVSGSPFIDQTGAPQNYFRVEQINPVTREVIAAVGQTDLFAIQGKIPGMYAVASPRGGFYTGNKAVSIYMPDPLTEVFYTTDGSVPTIESASYTGPITISLDPSATNSSTTLKYIVADEAGNVSQVFTEVYTINPGVTAPDLAAASDSGKSNIDNITNLTTLTFTGTAQANSTVTLLVDNVSKGSMIASSGTYQFTVGPLSVGAHSVTASGITAGGITGKSGALLVTIDTGAPTAVSTPAGGTYTSALSVSLTPSEQSTLYYTLDGSAPTPSSFLYTTSIPISQSTTLKFIAVDVAGNQSVVVTQTYTITPPTPPAAPSNVTAAANVIGQISLSWTDNSANETSFSVERSLSATSGFAVIGTLAPNTISFFDSTVGRRITYFYRVRALNDAGASAYSTTVSARSK